VAIHDFLPNEERTGPEWPLLFAVNMLVATESGSTYTFGEFSAWLRGAGFVDIRKLPVQDSSTVVLARKPVKKGVPARAKREHDRGAKREKSQRSGRE
jgi:hypothetical protein